MFLVNETGTGNLCHLIKCMPRVYKTLVLNSSTKSSVVVVYLQFQHLEVEAGGSEKYKVVFGCINELKASLNYLRFLLNNERINETKCCFFENSSKKFIETGQKGTIEQAISVRNGRGL